MRMRVVMIALAAALPAACGNTGAVAVSPPTGAAISGMSSSGTVTVPPPATGTVRPPVRPIRLTLQAWGVRDGKLWPMIRYTPVKLAVGGLAMRALLRGPNAAERAAGMSSGVPTTTRLLGLAIDHGIATVDLSAEFASAGSAATERMRLAQVVYTLTQFPTVHGVRLHLDGQPVSVFSGDGIVLPDPMTRRSFADETAAIMVTSPAIGGALGPGTTISGIADVFEGRLQYRILDGRGQALVSGEYSASCGTGCPGGFNIAIHRLDTSRASAGTLVVTDSDPSGDPSRRIVVRVPIELAPAFDVLSPVEGGTLTSPATIRFATNLPHGGPVEVRLFDSQFHLLGQRMVTGLCPENGYCPGSSVVTITIPFQVAGVVPGYLGFTALHGSGGGQQDALEMRVSLSGG
jgi:germination protein M